MTISAAQHRHIIERRQISSTFDADISANRLSEALSDIRYKRITQLRGNFWEVIGYVKSADRHVRIVLKIVSKATAKSGNDEIWIQTAAPAGTKKLRKWLLSRTFVELNDNVAL